MAARITKLQQMTTAELRAEWRRVLGEEPRSYHRTWLWKRLAWAIQAKNYGGLSALAQQRLEELLPMAEAWMPLGRKAFPQPAAPVRRDRRLPTPGTVITRVYKGRTLAVTVRDNATFEFDGKSYPSLTAIAKAVTSSHWNGRHFFGLNPARKAR
jgi:hypothetical protein